MSAPTDVRSSATYYEKVAAYYDFDSRDFEERGRQNAVTGRIRQQFRDLSEPYVKGNLLEIGCGPGMDLIYWTERRPDARIYGIDVSPGMLERARMNCSQLANVETALGSIEDVEKLFPGVRFDFAFCYFGALNTTRDLHEAAAALHMALKPGGIAVLTFVNRWYLFEVFWNALRGKWHRATARLGSAWGGYSAARNLESRCYSPADIRRAFGSRFSMEKTRGYSILYPAWYRHDPWVKRWPRFCDALWQADRVVNLTPGWRFGEYALYTLKSRPSTPS